MTGNERFEDSIGRWLEEAAPTRLPARVLDATFERTRRTRQEPAWRAILGRRQVPRLVPALGTAAAVVLAALLALNVGLIAGPGATPTTSPSDQPSSLAPAARPTSCRGLPSEAGRVLDCSRDGTRVLSQKGGENLFVVYADGSETQVTEQLTGITRFSGSARPAGATISPDGSRVVFAGLTDLEGMSCHNGALFVVAADGGPVELLWKSQVPQNGIVMYPMFSPDGTRIAFTDGYCDSDHSVWVMNADGSDAHVIVPSEMGSLSATHVRGLAWSPAGDRIALLVDQRMYTFGPDGSNFTQGGDIPEFCWPGRRC